MTKQEQLSLYLESENPKRLPLRAFIAPELHLLTLSPQIFSKLGSVKLGPHNSPLTHLGGAAVWNPAGTHRAGVPPLNPLIPLVR